MITSFCVCWGEQIDDEIVIIRNVPECFVQRCDGPSSDLMAVKPIRMKCDLNSYFVCLFSTTLKNCGMYRQSVTKALFKRFSLSPSSVLRIRIHMYSGKHIIDYTWYVYQLSVSFNHVTVVLDDLHSPISRESSQRNLVHTEYGIDDFFNRNDIIIRLCHEKRELDSAMAWLSTLGGAFSALGDHFQNCVSIELTLPLFGMN